MRSCSVALALALTGCGAGLTSFDPVPDPDTDTERLPDPPDPDTEEPDPDPDTDPDTDWDTEPDTDWGTEPDPDTDTAPPSDELEWWTAGWLTGLDRGAGFEWRGMEIDAWYPLGSDTPVCEFGWDALGTLVVDDTGPIPLCSGCAFAFENTLTNGRALSGASTCADLGYVVGSALSTGWAHIPVFEANGYTYYDIPGYYYGGYWYAMPGLVEVGTVYDDPVYGDYEIWYWVGYHGAYSVY